MLRIGVILFTIGLLMVSPLDEIFIIGPLSIMYGEWIFPLFFFIGLICFIIGAALLGKHLLPLLSNPIVIIMLVISIIILVYIAWSQGWFSYLRLS